MLCNVNDCIYTYGKRFPVKKKIVHSWMELVRFAIAGGTREKDDGLYKSLNYQLYIDKEKRKPLPPLPNLVVNVKLQLIGL